ncbi:MAG: hypothetical protein E7111_02440 [Bacteroidales bacterium]|nr:hypothetical protein [Bacteroidales bacterium]
MKRLVFIVLHILILATGCDDKDYISSLSVYNRTNSQIKIVSYIISDLYNTEQSFEMASGDIVTIAEMDYYLSDKFMSNTLYNADAFFLLYKKVSEEYVLVKEWVYKDYSPKERGVFNPLFYSMNVESDTKKHLERNFVFTILPEDLEGGTEP